MRAAYLQFYPLLLAVSLISSTQKPVAKVKPNVIFVFADQ